MSKYLDDLKAAFAAGYPVYYYGSLLKDPSWSGWRFEYYMEADDRSAWESYKKQREQKENCMCSGHKHAALMAEYAKDAAKTDKPWLLWEYKYDGKFYPLVENPMWQNNREYRRRPEQSDLEKYGVEVGDVWLLEESNDPFNYLITGTSPYIKGIILGTGKEAVLGLGAFENVLVFRRGEVNKL